MASTKDFVDYVCEQADLAGSLTSKKMFGEYVLYLEGKVIAMICANQLFVKATTIGKELLSNVVEAPPYPGAKSHFQVTEHIDNRELLKKLLLETAKALPQPKPKSRKLARPLANKRSSKPKT